MTSVATLQPEPAPIVACTVSRDVQNFEILIDDMESEMGEAWGDLGFEDALVFLDQPDAAALEFIAPAAGVYYLSIHENGLVEINDVIVSIDAPLQIAGYCTYLGTTELGMVYQFGLYSDDQLREGTFALDLCNTDYGEMTITPISGVNLFDAPEGGYTVFTRL